jgi:hypothetical protein
VSVHGAELRHPRTVVIDDESQSAPHPVTPQHFQGDIFGADPGAHQIFEAHPPDLWHGHRQRVARHGHGHIQTASAKSRHAEPASRGGMTVRTQQEIAGASEILHMQGVTYAITSTAVPQPEAAAGTLQEQVVVRAPVIASNQVVTDILHRHIGSDPVQFHGLRGEHDQRPGSTLGERLIDLQGDV